MKKLYHASHDESIERFEPRPPPSLDSGFTKNAVWAIDEERLVNYLLPRVTYYPRKDSKAEDVDRLIGPSGGRHIVAIESGWLERAMSESLWLYQFDPESFFVIDEGAGYHVSTRIEYPISKRQIDSPILELTARGVELRVVPSLWPLRDAVLESSLQFSFIRMRNARPRQDEAETHLEA